VRPLIRRLEVWFAALSQREQVLVLGAAGVLAGVMPARRSRPTTSCATASRRAKSEGSSCALSGVGLAAWPRVAASLRTSASWRWCPATRASSRPSSSRTASAPKSTAMAASTPAEDGLVEERVAVQVRGASLADAVRLLHELESGTPTVHVARLELRKLPDDPAGFAVTLEAAELHEAR